MPRPPDSLILGLDGPELRVPADIAVLLWPAIEAWQAEHVRMGASVKLDSAQPVVDRWSWIVRMRRVDDQEGFAREHGADVGMAGGRISPHGDDPRTGVPGRGSGGGAAELPLQGAPGPDGFLTRREAADVLGVTPQHVGRLVARGEIDGQKRGRDWVISGPSVQEHLRRTA